MRLAARRGGENENEVVELRRRLKLCEAQQLGAEEYVQARMDAMQKE